ncbi:hypothetical protein Glove_23g79 [Diversispora epigaea]|uniref:Uncharacterized protein n=1 Tax=Diversispora epigaea TaxID=1348612 RepID=A0A397JJ70_9GLOM|nr:hypothetical protein Glove_23g79 [Diversispora epigaea]
MSISSNSIVNPPPSIYGHTANLFNDYMIFHFEMIDIQLYTSQVYRYNIKKLDYPVILEMPGSKL